MAGYKRNQIEEAISAVLEPRSRQPTSGLRTRVKRPLRRTEGLVHPAFCRSGARYDAFCSAHSPGSGVEVWFSEYEGFALTMGFGSWGMVGRKVSLFQSCVG